jgi:phosphatidylinositol 3-kinase
MVTPSIGCLVITADWQNASISWNEWLTLPISYSNIPLSAQLAITIWDVSPSDGNGVNSHAVPFGGTTLPLFEQENTLQKGRQKCYIHRRKAADGLSHSTTPSTLPAPRRRADGVKKDAVDTEVDEMERLEKLFKKHEMGDIPRIDWLDQLVFRGVERRGMQTPSPHPSLLKRRQTAQKTTSSPGKIKENEEVQSAEAKGTSGSMVAPDEEKFTLYIDLPRFDFPIVFVDHEYPPPPISTVSHHSPSSSNVVLKPPPEVQYGPGINGPGAGYDGGRLFKVYDPEVGARDNPAESKHRRLVRSHRTGVLDRDLKPNAKIRDELNVGDALHQ